MEYLCRSNYIIWST